MQDAKNIRLLLLLGLSYFVFWACAPPSMMPPPENFADGQKLEVGFAGAGQVNLYEGDYRETFGSGQFWYYKKSMNNPNNSHGIQLNVSVGDMGGVGGGYFFRHAFRQDRSQYIGFEVGGGWLYLKSAMLMAWRRERSQIYLAPGLNLDVMFPNIVLPVGMSFALSDRMNLNIEAGVRPALVPISEYEPTLNTYGALGLGARW